MKVELDYQEIRYRLESYAVFRILRKVGAAFMLAFFHDQWKRAHRAEIGQAELVGALGAFREFVRMSEGEDAFDREPASYLDEWANEGFLRKFYPMDSTEACYELTPDSERALEWLGELSRRPFVGAESRLLSLFDALRDIAYGASVDPEEKRAELLRRKAEIDGELSRLEQGEGSRLDATGILERYYGAEDTARRLIADFKQIEQNFRNLDRETKERVIASDRSRGTVLREVFEHRDAIVSSDQGKSFSSFWAFLMSIDKREELAELVSRVLDLPVVKDASKTFPLDSLDSRLVGAGARVQAMTHRLNEELRHFLDERSRREGLRVGELVESFKRLALECREEPPPSRAFLEIEGDPDFLLVMDRPLWRPAEAVLIEERPIEAGSPSSGAELLYDIEEVDQGLLADRLRELLLEGQQTSLSELVTRFPVTRGAAEIVGYLSIASLGGEAAVWGERRAFIEARNERRRARFVADLPDPSYLPEIEA